MFTFFFNSESFVAFNNATEKNDSYKEIKKKSLDTNRRCLCLAMTFASLARATVGLWRGGFQETALKRNRWVGLCGWVRGCKWHHNHHINQPPPSPLVFLFSISSSSPPTSSSLTLTPTKHHRKRKTPLTTKLHHHQLHRGDASIFSMVAQSDGKHFWTGGSDQTLNQWYYCYSCITRATMCRGPCSVEAK